MADDIPDQQFRWETDRSGKFQREMEALLSKPDCPKVAVNYVVGSSLSPLTNKFSRTGMVPTAAVERCKLDQEYNHKFCHCLAHSYRAAMLEQARADNACICYGCSGPATQVVQVPTGSWFEERPTVVEGAAILLCQQASCDAKAKQEFMMQMQGLTNVFEKSLKATDLKQCANCTKLGEDMLRCSRCKATYYCSKECQTRDWPRHKLKCTTM